MRSRPTALAAALALSMTSVALGAVSCGSEAFTSNGDAPGDAGSSATGGSAGSSETSGSSGAAGSGGGAQAGEGASANGESGASAQGGTSAGGSAGDSGMTGSEGGAGGEAGGDTPCDPLLSPAEDMCVIDDAYAVFVSPAGSDDEGDGTKASPFESFAKAIESAALNDKRVFACADGGVFGERVSIDAEANGVEIYGGFSCDDWTYDATAKTSVVSPTPLALHIVDAEDVTIEGFRFEAADGSLPGESSVGAFVVNSTGVVLRRVEIVAGDGVKGADGGLVGFEYPEQEALNGNPESMGGGEKVCACQGSMTSIGGVGGVPSSSGTAGSKGLPDYGGGLPGTPDAMDCGAGSSGRVGAAAPNADAGPGATTWGSITAAGWQPAAGADGEAGTPGQGGGGGASLNGSGHGGGGGCGGCGGNGGTKGFGGGASTALIALESEIIIDSANLATGDAGSGGRGHAGQAGQSEVGAGGNALSSLNSCDGGNGGRGGDGGASGGGAGGISVGIVWTGDEAPIQTEVMFETGTFGEGGLGGEPGVNDGIDGLAQDVFEAT